MKMYFSTFTKSMVASLFFVIGFTNLCAQGLTGTRNVCTTCTYQTLGEAIDSLNLYGVGSGGVIINVQVGHTETIPGTGFNLGSSVLNASLNSANTLTIQKSGVGANPIFTSGVGTGTTDAMLRLLGTDFVTIDGLSFVDNVSNTTTTAQAEWGIALLKRNATAPFDGCQNNTIKNCLITLQKTNVGTRGIYLNNHTQTSTTALTITNAADANSFNKFLSNNISNVYNGIWLNGFNAITPFNLYDQNNEVGSDFLGNNITNFGGSSTVSYGIYAIYQNNIGFTSNYMGGGSGQTTTIYGIFVSTATGARTFIRKNTVSDTTSGANYPIYISAGTSGGKTYIDSNEVTACHNLTGTGLLYGIYVLGAADSVVVTNNQIYNNKSATSTGAFWGIGATVATGQVQIINNNKVFNNLRNALFYNIYSFGAGGFYTINNNEVYGDTSLSPTAVNYGIWQTTTGASIDSVTNNNIYNLINNGTGQVIGYFKNSSSNTGNKFIIGNNIYNLTSTSGSVRGINHPGGNTIHVSRNNIHNLVTNGAATQSIGVELGANAANPLVFNNFIADLKAPNSSADSAIIGIFYSNSLPTSFARLYHNTIYLNATTTNSLNSMCVRTNITPQFEMRNNILVNVSQFGLTGRTVAFWREGVTTSSYSLASNNNCFYTGNTPSGQQTIYFDGTNADSVISAFQLRMNGRENQSFSENVPFLNSTTTPFDLRISTSIPTRIESSGNAITNPITINRDYFNTLRNTQTPDVGAHEGNFTLLDIAGPSVIFNLLENRTDTSATSLSAIITDPSGVNVTTNSLPRLYYKKASELNIFNGNTSTFNGWKFVESSTTSNPFVFNFDYSLLTSPRVTGDSILYFVVAEDLIGNVSSGANLTIAPSTVQLTSSNFPITNLPNFFKISTSYSGNYSVGVGGNFASITQALDSLNDGVIVGPVTLNLTNAVYTSSALGGLETFPIRIKKLNGASAVNTITIKPTSGNNALITGTSGFAMLLFENGAQHVIINGSNNGTNTRNLFFHNTIATQSTGIFLESSNSASGVRDVAIRNCVIKGGSNTNSYAILIGGNIVSPHSSVLAGSGTRRIIIENNLMYNNYYGIVAKGQPSDRLQDITIRGNNIGTDSVGLMTQYFGVYLEGVEHVNVDRNRIFNIRTTSAISNAGIELNNNVFNSVIKNNFIHGIYSTSTSGYGAFGINIQTNTNIINDSIYNNVIYDLATLNYNSTSTLFNAFGIRITGSTNLKVYHNSVNLSANLNGVGGTNASASSALLIFSNPHIGLDIRNNIFANSTVGQVSGSNHFAFWTSATGPITGAIMNNNCFFVSGVHGVLSRLNATNDNTLNGLQTYTNGNSNSINANPLFNTNNNLVPQFGGPLAFGAIIPQLNRDILDTLRSITTPRVGAFERENDAAAPVITFTPLTNTNVLLNRAVNNVVINDVSGIPVAPGLKPRIYFKKTSDSSWFSSNNSSVQGWKWVEANNTNSPFQFIIDYSLLQSTVAVNDTIQYFVVAQDSNSITNVGSLPITGFVGTSVNQITTAPSVPFRYIITAAPLSGTYTIGLGGNYATIHDAFGALNLLGVSGPVTFALTDTNYTLTTPVEVFNFAGADSINTVTLRPANQSVSPNINGNIADVIFRLVGVNHFRIVGYDGLSNPSQKLTIQNSSVSGNTIAIRNDASNNLISYCNIKGANTNASGGIIVFNTTAVTGNSNNIIEHNYIHPITETIAPYNAIFMTANIGAPNNNNIIRNNYIFNYTNRGLFVTINNQNTFVARNHFYQTISRAATAAHAAIYIDNATGSNMMISNNYIGGSDTACGGTLPMTITGSQLIQLIYFSGNNTSSHQITGNTFSNMSLTTTNTGANHALVFLLNGRINCSNNIFGSDTAANSINIIFNGTAQSNFYVIGAGGTLTPNFDTVAIRNNFMGGISATGTGSGISLRCIDYSGTNGFFIFENNTIGSPTRANSITQNTSNSLFGLINRNSSASFNQRFVGNTISNLTSNTGILMGIQYLGATPAIIENNIVQNLISNSSTQTGTGANAAVIGMYVGSSGTGQKTIRRNIVRNIYTTTATAIANVGGIVHNNTSTQTNSITENKVYALHANSTATCAISGIQHIAGNANIANNFVSLGLDSNGIDITQEHAYSGIQKQSGNTNIIYNTVRVMGVNVSASSTVNTFAFSRTASGVDTLINNILYNERSNSTLVSGGHFAIGINDTINLQSRSNILYVSGINGNIGAVGSTNHQFLSAWQLATNRDLNSKSKAISFVSFKDLHLSGASIGDTDLIATAVSGFPTDIDGDIRNTQFPYKGADENLSIALPVSWLSFRGIKNENDITLTWVTASESNNKGFYIERKSDSKKIFEVIGFVSAKGVNSNSISTYTYVDKDANLNETNYYRLRQIDISGKEAYSKVVSVSPISELNTSSIKVYPNPIVDKAMAELIITEGEATIEITDMSGRSIKVWTINCTNGINYISLDDTDKLNTGMYILKVTSSGIIKSSKFSKL